MVFSWHCGEWLGVVMVMDLGDTEIGLQISRFENFALRIDGFDHRAYRDGKLD
jgi:hypothetical protein